MALVNLYSDTQTQPTAAMRAAIAAAEVGDEQRGADPTTRALEERVAALLGHEAAVFLPSGTMCNEIAIRLHIRPGGRADAHRARHAPAHRRGRRPGPALRRGDHRGRRRQRHVHRRRTLDEAIHGGGPGGRYGPRPRLVCVEQTTNMGGGRVWPLEQVRGVLDVARRDGPRHAPRRRAADERGRGQRRRRRRRGPAASTARGWTSPRASAPRSARAWPGSADFIEEAWRWKQMLGGAMRQSGIVAAAGLYALDHHVERLADDHARARAPGRGPRRAARRRARPRHRRDQHRHLRGARRGRLHRGARGRRTS